MIFVSPSWSWLPWKKVRESHQSESHPGTEATQRASCAGPLRRHFLLHAHAEKIAVRSAARRTDQEIDGTRPAIQRT